MDDSASKQFYVECGDVLCANDCGHEMPFYSSVGSACMSYIDVRDIAAIAAKSLTADSHAGKTYELNGPEALTAADVAGKISRLTGRGVRYVDIPFEALRKSLQGMGMPEWQVNALLELQEYYTQEMAHKWTEWSKSYWADLRCGWTNTSRRM